MAREVFFADSTSVFSSSGQVVRGSTTSALIPAFPSISAAPSATCTMLLVATIVISSPSRFTSATPKGMVYSCSGTGPFSLYIILSSKKRSEEHTSELQSRLHLVCRLLLEKKKKERRPSLLRAGRTSPTAPWRQAARTSPPPP